MWNLIFLWIGFNLFVLSLLALDLGVFHRRAHEVRLKDALLWSGVWIALSLLFNIGICYWRGSETALAFLAGYLIEKSLSVDNIFVFLMIFTYFRIPVHLQHKVLFWGILGAMVTRTILIAAGITLFERFHWMVYVFGAILILTGIKMALQKDKEIHPGRNPVLRLLRRWMPLTETYENGSFFVYRGGRCLATPLFLALLVVETTDLIFAVDSIPAILAITTDPFIVYTSNVFAILGLRALYFALAGVIPLFQYFHHGLTAILVFVGVKMLLDGVYKVPVGVALGIVAGILTLSIAASLVRSQRLQVSQRIREPVSREPV